MSLGQAVVKVLLQLFHNSRLLQTWPRTLPATRNPQPPRPHRAEFLLQNPIQQTEKTKHPKHPPTRPNQRPQAKTSRISHPSPSATTACKPPGQVCPGCPRRALNIPGVLGLGTHAQGVAAQVLLAGEAFAAGLAGVRPLPGVRADVALQDPLLLGRVGAERALVQLDGHHQHVTFWGKTHWG